jgi:hypothetical protein
VPPDVVFHDWQGPDLIGLTTSRQLCGRLTLEIVVMRPRRPLPSPIVSPSSGCATVGLNTSASIPDPFSTKYWRVCSANWWYRHCRSKCGPTYSFESSSVVNLIGACVSRRTPGCGKVANISYEVQQKLTTSHDVHISDDARCLLVSIRSVSDRHLQGSLLSQPSKSTYTRLVPNSSMDPL